MARRVESNGGQCLGVKVALTLSQAYLGPPALGTVPRTGTEETAGKEVKKRRESLSQLVNGLHFYPAQSLKCPYVSVEELGDGQPL